MDLDFTPVYTRQQTVTEVTRDVTYADLQHWTTAPMTRWKRRWSPCPPPP
jgi:hypothetical protein